NGLADTYYKTTRPLPSTIKSWILYSHDRPYFQMDRRGIEQIIIYWASGLDRVQPEFQLCRCGISVRYQPHPQFLVTGTIHRRLTKNMGWVQIPIDFYIQ